MALSFSLKNLCIAVTALLAIATSCCKAQAQAQQPQDSVQIVAKAALCFDDKTVIMNCITSAQAMANASGSTAQNSTFCGGPCYGQAMLLMNCMDGIFGNFQFYNAGMMQGMKSVFQMACGKNTTDDVSTSDNLVGTSHGAELEIPVDLVTYLPVLVSSFFLL